MANAIKRRSILKMPAVGVAAPWVAGGAQVRPRPLRENAFAHLHVHTEYSGFNATVDVDLLVSAIVALGMKAVAITDFGTVAGAIHFYERAKNLGVKPILGCEVLVEDNRRALSPARSDRLVLLATNNEGWRNLMYLTSMEREDGVDSTLIVNPTSLKKHGAGLVALSAAPACAPGIDNGVTTARRYQDIFGKGNYYLELQTGAPERVNDSLIRISRKAGVPLVATNNCRHIKAADAELLEILGKLRPAREGAGCCPTGALMSPAEMEQAFHGLPEAIDNAGRIAERCNVDLDLDQYHPPTFPTPKGVRADAYLAQLALAGLNERLAEAHRRGRVLDGDVYRSRLAKELSTIAAMKAAERFLFPWEFVRFARERGIAVGPGRGAFASSLVAHCLRITDVDPVAYGLVFERWFNPIRQYIPDVEVDFCPNGRIEVIKHAATIRGRGTVGRTLCLREMNSRRCVREVGRILDKTNEEIDEVAERIDEWPPHGWGAPLAWRAREDWANEEPSDGAYDLLAMAARVQRFTKTLQVEGGAFVIADRTLMRHVPCFQSSENEIAVTQFNAMDNRKLGLVRFSSMGLKTLTVVNEALARIDRRRNARGEPPFDIDSIHLGDSEVYRMLAAGDLDNVFLLGGQQMSELVKRIEPRRFSEIAAAIALCRPGPLESGLVDDFVGRKQGLVPVVYPVAGLQDVLGETYGLPIYQEQIIDCACLLTGFGPAQADLLRRALLKSRRNGVVQSRDEFIKRAMGRGFNDGEASRVFEMLVAYAPYSFAKGYAVSYGLLAYRTAYLKRHFLVEYQQACHGCAVDPGNDGEEWD